VKDASNGYEALADDFVQARTRIGAAAAREWALALGAGARVLDVGCGHGVPVTEALVEAGCDVSAIDASPALVERFRERFPGVPVVCEPVQSSMLFGRSFDGIVACGLLFLLEPDEQLHLIAKLGAALAPGGRLLVTAPWQVAEWRDVLTGRVSRSLGADVYRRALESAGLTMVREFDDEGGNHYYEAQRTRSTSSFTTTHSQTDRR
jgi:SAM-dependent methyltransferase